MIDSYYIALEGIDGCGKTTQGKLLAARLVETYPDREIVLTREPGASSCGEMLRKLVLERSDLSASARTLAFALDRALNISENIAPALERGAIVISDRCYISSDVYQNAQLALPESWIETIGLMSTLKARSSWHDTTFYRPDLILWLDVEPEIAAKNLKNSGKSPDYYEAQGKDFVDRLVAGYRQLLRYPVNAARIDGASSIENVAQEIFDRVELNLPKLQPR